MTPHLTPTQAARRRKERLAKWVGLLALAGLFAIATLPPHQGQHASAADLNASPDRTGGAVWHG